MTRLENIKHIKQDSIIINRQIEQKVKKTGLSRRELTKQILNEMIKILQTEYHPKEEFFCGTGAIKHFERLAKNSLTKYEELALLKSFDIQVKNLLKYLKESLNRIFQEEGEYNRKVALLVCQTILKREKGNLIY